MANRTNSSEYFWSYEYYWDYVDPIPVDGSKLKVNKCKYYRVIGANLVQEKYCIACLVDLFFNFPCNRDHAGLYVCGLYGWVSTFQTDYALMAVFTNTETLYFILQYLKW